MRGIIRDQVSHKFIEGPMQFPEANNSFEGGNDEKAAHHADLTQGYDVPYENAKVTDTFEGSGFGNDRYD